MIVKIVDDRVIVVLSALAAVIIYFYANFNGLGLTNDSLQYWEKSIIFAETHSFTAIGFNPVLPFQSLEIVLLAVFGHQSQTVFWCLHALFLGGTVFIHLMIAKGIFSSTKTLFIYAASLVFSTPLLMVHSFLWTEPLFIFLVSLQWYFLWRFFQVKTWKTFLIILLIAALYCWQRKSGMLFCLGLALAFSLHYAAGWKQIAGSILVLGLLIFTLWGGFGTPNFIGEFPKVSSFATNLGNYSNALSAWLLPLPMNYPIRAGLSLLLFVFAGYILWQVLPGVANEKKPYFTSIITIVLTYLVIRHFYDRPFFDEADRFLAPVYPGIFFLLIFAIEQFVLHTQRPILKLCIPVILALWLIYPAMRTFKNAKLWHNRSKIPLLIKEETRRTDKK